MSGTQTSTFADPNILYKTLSGAGYQEVEQNRLLNQQRTQDIGEKDMAMMGQAGASLLNLNEDQAAAAYPQVRDSLQAQGFGKNLPAAYPGHAVVQAFVQRAMPLMDQFRAGYITTPEQKAMIDRAWAGNQPSATSGGGGGTAGDGLTGDKAHDLPLIAQRESGGSPTVLNYVAQQDPTAYARGATASGKYQIVNSTWREGMQLAGLDPAQYATARDAPEQVQDKVASAIYDKYGAKPWQKGSQDWVKDEQGRYQMATVRPPTAGQPQQGGPGGATAAAPPPGVQMGGAPPPPPGGATGPYTGGGMGAVLAPGGPAGRRLTQAERLGGTQVAGPPMVASTNPTAATPATDPMATPAQYAGTTPAPSAEAPPETGWGSQVGSGYGPQNTLAPPVPAQPVAQTLPPAQQPPAARPPLATGVNSPQYQQGMQFKRQAAAMKMAPGYALNPQMQATAAWLDTQGDAMMKLETFQEDTQGGVHGQRNVLTNQFTPDPARRMSALANGDVINDQGRVIYHVDPMELEKDVEGQYWYVPKYPTRGPGGALVPPQPAGGNMPTPAFAEEQKVEATRLSKLRSEVLDRAKESAQANTMIANTETALADAQKGNLGAGALSPDKLRLVATAKALGINLAPFGIDADKLGAAQVTREQLQQLNGAILRKMYPQRITNADLAISGTVLPNYGLDPEALTSNFEIYKRQNDYDTRMAQDMLDYQVQHHTLVGWENQWHKKAGFGAGPIDNLFGDAQAGRLTSGGTGGGGGGQTGGGSQSTAPPAAAFSGLKEGDVRTFKNGQRWTLHNGQPVQVK